MSETSNSLPKEKFASNTIELPDLRALKYPNAEPVVSNATGRVIWELDFNEVSVEPVHGKEVKEFDTLCTIQTNYGLEHIGSFCNGRIVGVEKKSFGSSVEFNIPVLKFAIGVRSEALNWYMYPL